jgi:hypothetical protein
MAVLGARVSATATVAAQSKAALKTICARVNFISRLLWDQHTAGRKQGMVESAVRQSACRKSISTQRELSRLLRADVP